MKLLYTFALLAVLHQPAQSQDDAAARHATVWRLVWSAEFQGPAGSAPDPAIWTYDLGTNNGWGNNEKENYTNSTGNAFLDGAGHLIIQAIATRDGGFTSARLKTQGLYSVTYGKIEMRARIPFGQGLWPAFWMLGSDIDSVGWPHCGEIDIMENIGKEPSTVHGTVHGPGYSGNGIGAPFLLPDGQRFADDFHTFAVVWGPESVDFLVDNTPYKTVTTADLPPGAQWVFTHPFFLILNVAVGGNWPGYPDATTQFPQQMVVEYIRVYRNNSRLLPPRKR
jgi:beta-glucanase (GH16 family)